MTAPEPELIDNENPEWTKEDFQRAVPFPALPAELQALLSEEKHVASDSKSPSTRKPAA